MIAAARSQLGLIDERFAAPSLAAGRADLRAQDAELAAIARQVREGDPAAAERLAAWGRRAPSLSARLVRLEGRSLFDPKTLRTTLQARLPARAS